MNFSELKSYVKENRKVDISKLNNIKDLTNMIDFLNKEIDEKKKDRADEEIHSLTQFLERIQNRTTFILKKGR